MLEGPGFCLNPRENVAIILAYNQPSQAKNSDHFSVVPCFDVLSIFTAFAIVFMPASHVSGTWEVVYPMAQSSKSLV